MRTLKVNDVGDFYKKNVIPQVNLRGKWLLEAGLNPGDKVDIYTPEKGKIIIQIKEKNEETN